ncbi:MAG: hypothetical protein ACT4QD_18585 [Acidobacteriota bacterium]
MMSRTKSATCILCLWLLAAALPVAREAQAPETSPRAWANKVAEIEAYLKTAEIVSTEEVKVGVTRPSRAKLKPGGPVEAIAWKPIRPGRYNGFWESYRSEIAAYELDKMLGLGMVPPTVEKRHDGNLGAAVMWVSPTQSFKELGGVPGQAGVKGPPPIMVAGWMRQLTRAKMFDNLIANIDPNLGNWLVDPSWNLILIDHTRAFTTTRNLYHELSQVDAELWEKMKALDEAALMPVIGEWLDRGAVRAVLQRRDRMQQVIDKLSTRP